MADSSMESAAETVENTLQETTTPDGPYERPAKLKGRKRLLQSLQRISSSPSVTRLGRSSSGSYRGIGKGSISCISLTSSSYSNGIVPGLVPQSSQGYSTAPTSIPGTPPVESSSQEAQSNARVPGRDAATSKSKPSTSVSVPSDVKVLSRPPTACGQRAVEEDYFSPSVGSQKTRRNKENFDFWGEMPPELRVHILQFLKPKEIVRCSAVSKLWFKMCFDGQLWRSMDAEDFYRSIPAEGLVKIITQAAAFVRDLNLRGCVQLSDMWRGTGLADACQNLENLSLEGCRIDRGSIHSLLYQNTRLAHINLTGLMGVTNSTMRIIAQCCPNLEHLNVSWCNNIDTRGLRRVIESCDKLRDLRAGEVRGFDDTNFMNELFKRNTLERLMINNCDSLNDESLTALIEGTDTEIDFLTGRRDVEARRLRHLDISRCRNITDAGLRALVHNAPRLEGLRLSKCRTLTDNSLTLLIPTLPNLTHLDLEELDQLTNATLQELATSPCKDTLQHLSISYCEQLGDTGMLPVVKSCAQLRSLDLDNTRISDLVLAEAAAMVRQRCSPSALANRARSLTWDGASAPRSSAFSAAFGPAKPKVGLRMHVYDCQNVTWTGIREVLSRNAEIRRPMPPTFLLPSFAPPTTAMTKATTVTAASATDLGAVAAASSRVATAASSAPPPLAPTVVLQQTQAQTQTQTQTHSSAAYATAPSHPHQIIELKVFYGYQPTVHEHTRRVLRGDLASASRLERKWADYMMATEEAGAAMGVGTGNGLGNANAGLAGLGLMGSRRRRRRVREAQMMHADEEEGGAGIGVNGPGQGGGGGIGRRRRARSGGGCLVM